LSENNKEDGTGTHESSRMLKKALTTTDGRGNRLPHQGQSWFAGFGGVGIQPARSFFSSVPVAL
jgi:hypothetical protein